MFLELTVFGSAAHALRLRFDVPAINNSRPAAVADKLPSSSHRPSSEALKCQLFINSFRR